MESSSRVESAAEALEASLSTTADVFWRYVEWLTRSATALLSSPPLAPARDSPHSLLIVAAPCLAVAASVGLATMVAGAVAFRCRKRRRRSSFDPDESACSNSFPESSRARPANRKRLMDVVAARMANVCLANIHREEDIKKKCLQCWLQGINQRLKEESQVWPANVPKS